MSDPYTSQQLSKARVFITENKCMQQAEMFVRKLFSNLPGDSMRKEAAIVAMVDGLRAHSAGIYAELFTEGELDQMIAWARSPIAAKARELQPLIMQRAEAALGPYMANAHAEFLRKLESAETSEIQ